jgi:hypothetical protein
MRARPMPLRKTIGRCPDCGHAVEVCRRAGRPGTILPHGCPLRVCEYPDCRATGAPDAMVQRDEGAWYCPPHGLVAVVEELIALYRVPGVADWNVICEIISDTLPQLLAKLRAWRATPRRLCLS